MDGYEAVLNVVLANDGKLEHETVAHRSATNLSAMKAALVKPGGHGNDLLPKPQSHRQVMESPEWKSGKRRRKQRWVASSAKESGRSARALRERRC